MNPDGQICEQFSCHWDRTTAVMLITYVFSLCYHIWFQLIETEAQCSGSEEDSEESDGELESSFINDQSIMSQQLSQGINSSIITSTENVALVIWGDLDEWWYVSVRIKAIYTSLYSEAGQICFVTSQNNCVLRIWYISILRVLSIFWSLCILMMICSSLVKF